MLISNDLQGHRYLHEDILISRNVRESLVPLPHTNQSPRAIQEALVTSHPHETRVPSVHVCVGTYMNVCMCAAVVPLQIYVTTAFHFLAPSQNSSATPPTTGGRQWEQMASCFTTTRFNYHFLVVVTKVQSELLSVNMRVICQT